MSSKRRVRRKSCERKKRYETSAEAGNVLKFYTVGSGYHVYKCDFCGGYHIGRMSAKRKEAARRNGRCIYQLTKQN